MEEMTILSAEMFDLAQNICSIDEAYKQLEKYSYYHRSLEDVLRKFYDFVDIKAELAELLRPWMPGIKEDSVRDNVKNWLKNGVDHKEKAFKLSRALHLDLMPDDPEDGTKLHNTDSFLKMTVGEGFHWRDPQDIVWAYAACHDYDYEQTAALEQKVQALGSLPSSGKSLSELHYTMDIKPALFDVLPGTEEELLSWLKDEWHNLGKHHNCAYKVFCQLFNTLENPYGKSKAELAELREKIEKELDAYNKVLANELKHLEKAYTHKEERARELGRELPEEYRNKFKKLMERYSRIPLKLSDPRFRRFLEDISDHPDSEYLFSSVEHLLFDHLYRQLVPFTKHASRSSDAAVIAAEPLNPKNASASGNTQKTIDMWEAEAEWEAIRYEKRHAPKNEAFTMVQKIIKANWPEATVISRMKSREVDVNRKVLLLLFLTTNGLGSEYQSKEDPHITETYTKDQLFREKYQRCQQMLAELGFSGLDPRNPFDWLIIFCFAADDSDDDEYYRMSEMLKHVFPITV